MASLEIQLIAIIVAVNCALPGVFLMLRKMAMLSESITHTILLGIVLAYFATRDLSSPLLIIGASLMGLITVWFTELIQKTKLVSEDSAIGVVFPMLFSIAIILITRNASYVHLDTDSVLLGELAFAPFNRMIVFGYDIGPKAIYSSGIILIINMAVISLMFKELKIATFDPMFSSIIGFSPLILHYGIMSLVSITVVGAFEAVGSILVVAFMIGPPAISYLLTDNLKVMLILSSTIGALSAVLGFQTAIIFDISIAGSIAVIIGLLFSFTLIFSPKSGLITKLIKKHVQKEEFSKNILLAYIYNNQYDEYKNYIYQVNIFKKNLNWTNKQINNVIHKLANDNSIVKTNDIYKLTEKGIKKCRDINENLF